MNDPSRPSLLERLSALIMREPGDRAELAQLLRSAYSRNLLDADALSIIEGALTVSEMAVRDIMIPRAQVDFIDINEPVETFVTRVIGTAHSRFPVIAREARAQGKTLAAHYAHLVLHGVLHLRGYRHEKKRDAARMEAREIRILRRVGITNPYAVE